MSQYNRLRIGTDCDGCINEFWDPYVKRFGLPKSDTEITRNVQQKLKRDKDFWVNLPVLHKPDFNLTLYCTKRTSRKAYLKQWIENNDFPIAPIYQVLYQYDNKARFIKGRVDVFVDDSVYNFITMNQAGVPCLLMDNPANQHLGPMLRVHSLDYDELADTYFLAKELGVFDDFNLYYGN